jgi:allophanate hydrolase subunit 2
MNTPNPEQPHVSLATTGSASTLAALGFVLDPETAMIAVQAVGGDVRMTVNGNAPTTSLGIRLSDGDIVELEQVEIGTARFITASGTPRLEIASYVLS